MLKSDVTESLCKIKFHFHYYTIENKMVQTQKKVLNQLYNSTYLLRLG